MALKDSLKTFQGGWQLNRPFLPHHIVMIFVTAEVISDLTGTEIQPLVFCVGPVSYDHLCVWDSRQMVSWLFHVLEDGMECLGFLYRGSSSSWTLWVCQRTGLSSMYLQILSDSHIYYNLTHYENFTIYRYSGNKTCTRVFLLPEYNTAEFCDLGFLICVASWNSRFPVKCVILTFPPSATILWTLQSDIQSIG